MTNQDAANELLMGGGIPSIKWKDETIGYTVVGNIVEQPKVQQMKKYKSDELDYWPSGDPKMQIVCTLQTDLRDPGSPDDDGRRRLFIEPRMMAPVREAVQRAGARGLAIGGRLAVRWISGSGEGEGNARQFAAEYAAPAVEPDSMLGNSAQPQPAAAGAVQQPATPQPATAAPAGGMLTTPPPAAPADTGPPPGVDPQVWATLPDQQRAAVLAAMGPPAAPATGGDPAAHTAPF